MSTLLKLIYRFSIISSKIQQSVFIETPKIMLKFLRESKGNCHENNFEKKSKIEFKTYISLQ